MAKAATWQVPAHTPIRPFLAFRSMGLAGRRFGKAVGRFPQ